jgi:hypothetical protein
MRATYAVVWCEGEEPVASGRLEIRPQSIAFSGGGGDGAVERELPLESLCAVRVGRSPQDRLEGRASLVLERRNGPLIRVAGVAQPGIVAELAQRLAGLEPVRQHTGCSLVRLALKEGALARARELAASRPSVAEDVTGTNGYAGTLSFEPTPGPGDSEGGDLYAPEESFRSKMTSTLSCSYPTKRCSAPAGTNVACPSRSSTRSPSTSSTPLPSSTT